MKVLSKDLASAILIMQQHRSAVGECTKVNNCVFSARMLVLACNIPAARAGLSSEQHLLQLHPPPQSTNAPFFFTHPPILQSPCIAFLFSALPPGTV